MPFCVCDLLCAVRSREVFTSNVDGLQSEGLLLVGNQGGLLGLIGHGWQGLYGSGVRAVWPR